ncbi:MAG: DUF192 domain-containing protein [Pseudomonadota bacterium]
MTKANAMLGNPIERGLSAALIVALTTACSPNAASPASPDAAEPSEAVTTSPRHPVSGLEIIEVAIISGDTRTSFKTELAVSQADQARGLMFRETLGDDEAMLFPNDPPQTRSFWMKNTPISLDIIFIGPDRRITNIETAVPYSLESVASDGAVVAVFEIRGGLADELGIKSGDLVEWQATG